MNVQQAIEEFLRHGQTVRNLSDRTLRAYESDLVQFRSHVPETEMVHITPDHLEDFLVKLGTEPYRDTSIRRKVAALKVFFRYLEDHGVVSESPAKRLKIKQPVETKVPNVLTTRELKALLSAPKRQMENLSAAREESAGARNRYFCAVRDNVIIELLFSTGIRIGELVALDVDDVNLESNKLTITGRGTRGRNIEVKFAALIASLTDYMALRAERELENTALFVGRSGTRLTIYSIENIFKKYVRSADIKRHVTPHSLRHTMAAMLINNGTDIRAVQEVLGHASILSTQVYTRLNTSRGRRANVDVNPRERIAIEAASARLPIRKR
jgi:integrase/recombinase XerC/integrase/recombinase XerD